MGNRKISELAAPGPLTGAEEVPVVQGGETVRPPLSATADYAHKTATSFAQTGAGAAARSPQDKGREVVNYGDHATLQQSLDECYASGKKFIGRKGATITLTSPLLLQPSLVADFTGMKILAGPAITSGAAVIIDGSYGAGGIATTAGTITGLYVYRELVSGHADPASNVDGLSLGGAGGQVSDMTFHDLRIVGFRDGLRFDGPNCYLNHFHAPKIGKCWRRGVAMYATTNSNENTSFFGGSIYNVNNTSFDGVGFYIDSTAGGVDAYFHGTSFDYNDYSIRTLHSYVHLFGCHLENNNNNPHILTSRTGGKPWPFIGMYGGTMATGPGTVSWTGIPVEVANGRPSFIVGGDMDIVLNGTVCGTFKTGEYVTEIVTQTGGLLRRYDVRPQMDASNGSVGGASVPRFVNRQANGLYVSTTNLNGWNQNSASGGTLSFDNTVFKAPDVGSRKAVGTLGNSLSFRQKLPVRAGQTIVARAYIRAASVSAGALSLRCDWYAQDGTTQIPGGILSQTVTADTAGAFVPVWLFAKVPAGVVTAEVWDYCNAFTGTAWFSDENVWIY